MTASWLVAPNPPQGAAVALVGQRAVLVQLHAAAGRTSRALDGDGRQTPRPFAFRRSFMGAFRHAGLLPVSPHDIGNMRKYLEFMGFFA
jgi:hypothetical protein